MSLVFFTIQESGFFASLLSDEGNNREVRHTSTRRTLVREARGSGPAVQRCYGVTVSSSRDLASPYDRSACRSTASATNEYTPPSTAERPVTVRSPASFENKLAAPTPALEHDGPVLFRARYAPRATTIGREAAGGSSALGRVAS